MRICSLLPSATEVIASLGLSHELVGISHECDYPPSVKSVPIMVEPMIPPHGLASADIDRQVRQLVASGQRLYRLKDHLLRQAQPDLILSQDLCHVCAVTPDQLHDALRSMPHQPTVLTLNPCTVHDVIDDVVRIGDAAGRSAEGQRLAAQLRDDSRPSALASRASRSAPAWPVSNGSLHSTSPVIGFLRWSSSPAARMSSHSLVAPRGL